MSELLESNDCYRQGIQLIRTMRPHPNAFVAPLLVAALARETEKVFDRKKAVHRLCKRISTFDTV